MAGFTWETRSRFKKSCFEMCPIPWPPSQKSASVLKWFPITSDSTSSMWSHLYNRVEICGCQGPTPCVSCGVLCQLIGLNVRCPEPTPWLVSRSWANSLFWMSAVDQRLGVDICPVSTPLLGLCPGPTAVSLDICPELTPWDKCTS